METQTAGINEKRNVCVNITFSLLFSLKHIWLINEQFRLWTVDFIANVNRIMNFQGFFIWGKVALYQLYIDFQNPRKGKKVNRKYKWNYK